MQLQLISCHDNKLTARAPATPNLNDKGTIFGGSSSALMTVCGWSLIKYNLEQRGYNNDVVIAETKTRWRRAQNSDMLIIVRVDFSWSKVLEKLKKKQQTSLSINAQVDSEQQKRCTVMQADYVILNDSSD